LLPKVGQIGLFADKRWFSAKNLIGKSSVIAASDESFSSHDQSLGAFSALLDQHEGLLKRCKRIQVLVGDSLARYLPINWQPALQTQSEFDQYAKAYFEKNNSFLKKDWLVVGAYPRFGEMGIAYGLPREWVSQLISLLQDRKLVLDQVIPVSAAAFCTYKVAQRDSFEILMLIECGIVTALSYQWGKVSVIDVEPAISRIDVTIRRLLRRIDPHSSPSRVSIWASDSAQLERYADYVRSEVPTSEIRLLLKQQWI
jgi:hypothetical protein